MQQFEGRLRYVATKAVTLFWDVSNQLKIGSRHSVTQLNRHALYAALSAAEAFSNHGSLYFRGCVVTVSRIPPILLACTGMGTLLEVVTWFTEIDFPTGRLALAMIQGCLVVIVVRSIIFAVRRDVAQN